MESTKAKINSLQGLRFYCAIVIFFVHCNFVNEMKDGSWYRGEYFNSLGNIVITFYFLLSGYVIALNYKERFCKLQKNDFFSFIKRRYCKMALPYIVTMLYVFCWWVSDASGVREVIVLAMKFIFSMSMMQTLTVRYWNLFNAVCWFSSCILVCYILAPFILAIAQNNKKRFQLLATSAYALLVLLMVVVQVACHKGMISAESANLLLYATPYARSLYFIIGLGIAGGLDRKFNLKYTYWECICVVCVSIAFLIGLKNLNHPENNIVYIPILCFVIYIFSHEGGFVSKFFSNRVNVFLGNISMNFYMLHYIVIHYGGKQIWAMIFGDSYSFAACIVMFILTLILSIVFLKWENGVQRYRNARTQ